MTANTALATEPLPPPKPERCPSCNAIIDPFNGACRCFD